MIDVNSLPMYEEHVCDSVVLIPTGDEYDDLGVQWYHVVGMTNGEADSSLGVHDVIYFTEPVMPFVDMLMDGCVRIHLGPQKRMIVYGYTSACTIKVAR